MTLYKYTDSFFETVLVSLDAIYPFFQQSISSMSASTQLHSHILTLFGVLSVVLRAPYFDTDQGVDHMADNNKALGKIYFLQVVKFAQLQDEIVNQWVEDINTLTDEFQDWNGLVTVRASVLASALGVYPSYLLTIEFQTILCRILVAVLQFH